MSPKETAYIVERLAVRFMAMVADYERKLVEHRDSFGARTSADAKIIEGLRRELFMLTGLNDKLIVDREEAWKERDGLLTQVQDMRAEIKQRAKEQDQDHKTIVSLMSEREGLRVQVQDMREEIIRVNDAHGQTLVECDALRAKVDLLTTLRPKYKVGDKLESYSSAVTIVGVRTVYDCQADGAEYPVGHSEDELKECYEQAPKHPAPKHPVKVGEWVRRTKKCAHFGHVAKVLAFIEPFSYEVQCIEGRGIWYFHNCEPCDQPATHDTDAGKATAESGLLLNGGLDVRKVTT